jgi:succinoglycan biosynthesis transport protein ExoP
VTEAQFGHGSTLGDHVRVLRQRKWIVLGTTAVVTFLAVVMSVRQSPLYETTAQVMYGQQSPAQGILGYTPGVDPSRDGSNQAIIATSPAVKALVATTQPFKRMGFVPGRVSVAASPDASVLDFIADNGDPKIAIALANAYAEKYLVYRNESSTRAIVVARERIATQLKNLVRGGQSGSKVYGDLLDRDQQLQTAQILQTSTASLVSGATDAAKTRPKPVRNAILGFVLGSLLGIAFAFLWNALDTRIRAASEIGERLGLPLLARIPEPPRRLRAQRKLVMLEDPDSPQAEAFRMLRTNLEFANLERGARSIMVTSAVEEEGKSTTVSNLAVALARTGRRVVLVDLDLRRPALATFFDLNGRLGLTDIALGNADLDEALVTIPVATPSSNGHFSVNGDGTAEGELQVLTSGPLPPDAGEFMESRVVTRILRELQARVDFVLIDVPPLLHVGDAMALTAKVDALLLVSRLNVLRKPMVTEVRRLLTNSRAVTLGYIVTGSGGDEEYGQYGYYYRARTKEHEVVS